MNPFNTTVTREGSAVRAQIDPEQLAEYTRRGWWRDRVLTQDLTDHAQATPDKVAVVTHFHEHGERVITYRELADIVDRIATGLLELGVGQGDVVSFQLPNWWHITAMHLAATRIGAVSNIILPILGRREVGFILDRVRPKVLVLPAKHRSTDFAETAAQVSADLDEAPQLFAITHGEQIDLPAGVRSFEEFFAGDEIAAKVDTARLDALTPDPNMVAQIQYTSGTTGEPKGVVHTWNTAYAGALPPGEATGLTADDVLLVFSPMGHTTGFDTGVIMPIVAGQTAVLQDVWHPEVALRLTEKYGASWTMAATPFIVDLCETAEKGDFDTSSLKQISSAGAPIPPSLIPRAKEILGARMYAVWGMTEVGPITSTWSNEDSLRASESDGQAPEWSRVKIVGADDEELPRGEEGRLVITGASNLIAYYLRGDIFKSSHTSDGWFDTGDMARMDARGAIRITGRIKDLVMRGGENVPVVEIENLLRDHELISNISIVGIPDDRLGERAAAVVVAADPSRPPVLADLSAHLEQRGVTRQFWPEYLTVIEEFPQTATGKVQRFRIREIAANPEGREERS